MPANDSVTVTTAPWANAAMSPALIAGRAALRRSHLRLKWRDLRRERSMTRHWSGAPPAMM
jgi:hypothetical protein